jgi:hypothetical protein
MTPTISAMGWVKGKLRGPHGSSFEVERVDLKGFDHQPLTVSRPNLILHTTEADDLGERYFNWDYPPQFAVGDHRIVQFFPVDCRGYSVDTQDLRSMQIEITGRSKLQNWLPRDHALNPLVALMAFLHEKKVVKTALKRPADWPIHVDYRGGCVPASDCYYRRLAGLWPRTAGVYGHLEIPDDEHWDPGGLDYPKLFAKIRDVLEDDMTDAEKALLVELKEFRNGFLAFDPKSPDAVDLSAKPEGFKNAYRKARQLANFPKCGEAPQPE